MPSAGRHWSTLWSRSSRWWCCGMDSMLLTLWLIIGAVTFGTIASPLLSVIYGCTGFRIERIEPVGPDRRDEDR